MDKVCQLSGSTMCKKAQLAHSLFSLKREFKSCIKNDLHFLFFIIKKIKPILSFLISKTEEGENRKKI